MKPLAWICVCGALLASCSESPDVVIPSSSAELLLADTKPLTPVMRSSIEGVYRVTQGADIFGDHVVLKWSYAVSANLSDTTFTLSLFTGRDMTYFSLEGGTLDSVFMFFGYWRKMVNTETGTANMIIGSSRGGRLLFQPSPVVGKDSIIIQGQFGSGQGLPDKTLSLAYERPLFTGKRFEVIAHRGGGRTADLLPVSENTVDMILFAPRLGSTAIEIDVRETKDGVLILYHDNEINTRLTQRTGLVGDIEQYTYPQLQAYVRLIHGETIPTLEDVLDATFYRTPIRVVYLDSKKSANLAKVQALQKKYLDLAAAAGRDFSIYIGIPSDDIMNEFLALPNYASTPALCELSVDDVRRTNALVWGPRWTLGTQVGTVAQMHAEGRSVYTWTMDVPGYVQEYITTGDFDGMVTNYPPMVAYYHYSR